MSYPITEQLISFNRSEETLNYQGIVIHSTATPGATAQNEHDYFNSGDRQASAHGFIDWTQIIRTIPENEVSWGCGPTGNHKYLNYEMCEPAGYDPAKFQEVWNRTVWLVAEACVRNNWGTGPNVFSHRGVSLAYHETNHTDPIQFLAKYGKTWDELLAAIDAEIEVLRNAVKVPEDNDPDVYLSVRVRTSKADALVAQVIAMGYATKKLDLA